jgi:hypothetical protein
MHILYLDESGGPNSWNVQNHFVLGGVAIHEGQIDAIAKRVNALQSEYFPGLTVPIHFHATEIREGIGRFRLMQRSRRDELLEAMYSIINDFRFPHEIVFAVAIHVSSVTNGNQALHDTFEEICSRFNNFLIWQYRSGVPSKGLVILDEVRMGEYRHIMDELHASGTRYGYLGNIVDIPYFAKCNETRMLQLADFISNAVFRYYERRENKYLDMVLPVIYKKPITNKIDGAKHITKLSCDCFCCKP